MVMVFVNVIFLIQFMSFSATFFAHNLVENTRHWGCRYYTVTIALDLNNFFKYQRAI